MGDILAEGRAATSVGYGAGDDDAFAVIEDLLNGVSIFSGLWAIVPSWMHTQMRRDPRYRTVGAVNISQWDIDCIVAGSESGPKAFCRVVEAT